MLQPTTTFEIVSTMNKKVEKRVVEQASCYKLSDVIEPTADYIDPGDLIICGLTNKVSGLNQISKGSGRIKCTTIELLGV